MLYYIPYNIFVYMIYIRAYISIIYYEIIFYYYCLLLLILYLIMVPGFQDIRH